MYGMTIWQELLYLIQNWQGGTVTLRRVMQPLFDEATAYDQCVLFFADMAAATDAERALVEEKVYFAGLHYPAQPESPPPDDGPGDMPPPIEPPPFDPNGGVPPPITTIEEIKE